VSTADAYKGPSENFGQSNDPLVGEKVGGVNVFGGGLGLYAVGATIVGGVGVSGRYVVRRSQHRVARPEPAAPGSHGGEWRFRLFRVPRRSSRRPDTSGQHHL
jgi:hypothetical protein